MAINCIFGILSKHTQTVFACELMHYTSSLLHALVLLRAAFKSLAALGPKLLGAR